MESLITEFLLWDNCKNNCSFCHLKCKKSYSSFLNNDEKEKSIKAAKDYISGPRFLFGSSILLCGGELFDTPFTKGQKEQFDSLANIIFSKTGWGVIPSVFVNTNLIYDINTELTWFLDIAKKYHVINKINFTTSFDLVGRYSSDSDKRLVKDNIHKLHILYPDLRITANMILTRPVCNLLINEDISYLGLQQDIGATINLIPYIILKDDLAPSKKTLFSALDTINAQVLGFIQDLATRFDTEPKRLLFKFYNGEFHNQTSEILSCGHSANFSLYSKEGTCFVCDLKNHIKELEK